MRISEFKITHYGPLRELAVTNRKRFTLFYGPNEHGKTLVIDALLRMLFKRSRLRKLQQFGNMRRVTQEPDGFVVIESHNGAQKMDSKETVADYYAVPIEPVDFRNVFMIRDSDLSVLEEDTYYTSITEKLTGMRTAELRKLKETIRKKGQLTSARSDAPLADSAEFDKIAGKVQRAEELIADITHLKDKLKAIRFEELEKDLAVSVERLSETRAVLELHKSAAKRERLEKSKERLNELVAMTDELTEFQRLAEEDMQRWEKAEWNREKTQETLSDNTEQMKQQKQRLDGTRQMLESLRSKRIALEESQGHINVRLQPGLEEYRKGREELSEAAAREGMFRRARNVSLAVLVIALIGSIFTPSILLLGVGVLALAGTLFFGGSLMSLARLRGSSAAAWERLRMEAASLGLDAGESVEDLLQSINEFAKKLNAARWESERAERDLDDLQKDTVRVQKDIKNQEETLIDLQSTIRSCQAESGVDSIEDFRHALKRKHKLQQDRSSLQAVLASDLGSTAGEEASVEEWYKKISGALGELDSSATVTYDPAAVKAMEREAELLERDSKELAERLEVGNESILRMMARVNAAKLPVQASGGHRTLAALSALEEELQSFCARVTAVAEAARKGLRIFERIEEEEKSRVSNLFGRDALVSKYFADTTEGRYATVQFDIESSEVYVTRPDGTRLGAGCLSGGALDQLYLAIRLSIGEQLLKGDKGFFIMDDPFIKSDFERMSRQMAFLVRLAEDGWQILYFSAKKEVLDALQGPLQSGVVQLVELEEPVAAE
ncbi:MAG: AAA family ATPase [Candidatus Latescibacterota bacterium]